MITSAFNNSDYHYFNRSGKAVCFHFKFDKRCKTKLIEFLRNNHEEAKILKYCEKLDLKLNKFTESRKYIHYVIYDENYSGGLLNEK